MFVCIILIAIFYFLILMEISFKKKILMEIICTSIYLQIIVKAYTKLFINSAYFGLLVYKIKIK